MAHSFDTCSGRADAGKTNRCGTDALAPEHRLRLAISSSNFDRSDINPNTGEPYGNHAVTRELMAKRFRRYESRGYESRGQPQYTATLPAKNTIYMDRSHPTYVLLPILADATRGPSRIR